jgi:hypothetical protein
MDGEKCRNSVAITILKAYPGVLRYAPFALALFAGGCVVASAPLKHTPEIVATPEQGELSVAIEPANIIGEVQPVYVSIANGTDTPRAVVRSQIFALNESGQRVAPIPPGEAARQAGGAGELKAALASGAASGAVAGALGAGIGAIAGSLIHSGATGAALGGAIGGGEGALQRIRGSRQSRRPSQRTTYLIGAGERRRTPRFHREWLCLLSQGQLQGITGAAGR